MCIPPQMTVLASNSVLGAESICSRQAAVSDVVSKKGQLGVDDRPVRVRIPKIKNYASTVGTSYTLIILPIPRLCNRLEDKQQQQQQR